MMSGRAGVLDETGRNKRSGGTGIWRRGIPRTERERMTMSSTARGVGETIKDPRIVIEFEVQLSKEINEIIGSPTREGKSKE